MEKIKVISSDKDGAELRREKKENRYHIRCNGSNDNDHINEAISSVNRSQWGSLGSAWDRIFGGKH
jgi:hypothetical protein